MFGVVGHLLILLAFVACGLSAFAYFQSARTAGLTTDVGRAGWKRIGRISWSVLLVAVLGASAILMYLLLTHQFQYAYVYGQTSMALPTHFLVSSFWAGQEGSFLLWIAMMSVLGVVLIRTTRGG